MGFKNSVTDAVFSRALAFLDYPIRAALTDLYFLGTSEAASCANDGSGVDATRIGTVPTWLTGYATWPADARLAGATLDTTNDLTLSGVFNMTSASSGAQVIGNLTGAGTNCIGLHRNSNAVHLLAYNGATGDNTTVSLSPPAGDFVFAAGAVAGTTKHLYVGIAGVLTHVSETFARTQHASNAFAACGDNAFTSLNESNSVALAAVHQAALSVDDVQALYDWARWYYAQIGMTVY